MFKGATQALVSVVIYLLLVFPGNVSYIDQGKPDNYFFGHPLPIGLLIIATTYMLAFRANFAYNRYWEACTAVHQMHSKWMDGAMLLAAFHLQATRYEDEKPPTFALHPEMTCDERQKDKLESELEFWDRTNHSNSQFRSLCCRKPRKNEEEDPSRGPSTKSRNINSRKIPVIDRVGKSVRNSKKPWPDGKPPLFLQELAHLMSLRSAVAMSTLRNDIEECDTPLTTFTRGMPWPHTDPDDFKTDVRRDMSESSHRSWTLLKYLMGFTRTPKSRTLYNAARPFRVVGGISDEEVAMLSAARGPLAKVALCFMWVNEFVSREYLNGSTGKVAPPIVGRVIQFESDGMLGYNQARKIAYEPFPFPHAQISSFFVLLLILLIPFQMVSYVYNLGLGAVLCFLVVLSFAGLHEVARELENPFLNAPNDLPLNNYQAQFNESLMTMYTGYHPDSDRDVFEEQGEYPPQSSSSSPTPEIKNAPPPEMEVPSPGTDTPALADESKEQTPPEDEVPKAEVSIKDQPENI